MKEKFTVKGTYLGNSHEVTWENELLFGSKEIIQEFNKLSKEMEGDLVGPFETTSNFVETPISTLVLLEIIMPDMEIIDGNDFVEYLDSLSI